MISRVPFDSLSLMCVTYELKHSVLGGSVQHVGQPDAQTLVLTVRRASRNHLLMFSCSTDYARVHQITRKPQLPRTPFDFCMVCRKHLEGSRLASVIQTDFDRVLTLTFESAHTGPVRLIAELMGKHSNLVLVDTDGRTLDSCKRIGSRLNRMRQTLPGVKYNAPPEQAGRVSPFLVTPPMLDHIGSEFEGMSPFLVAELRAREESSSPTDAWESVFGAARRGEWQPVLITLESGAKGAYPLPTVQEGAASQQEQSLFSEALESAYSVRIVTEETEHARHHALGLIGKALQKAVHRAAEISEAIVHEENALTSKEIGQLLLGHASQIGEGADTAELYGFQDLPEEVRTVALDSNLSVSENAEKHFARYKHAKAALPRTRARLDQALADRERLARAHAELEAEDNPNRIRELSEEVGSRQESAGQAGTQAAGQAPTTQSRFGGKKIRVVPLPTGWQILYGENSEANDYLTTRVAAPHETWLHVRSAASAHVLVRAPSKGLQLPPDVLMQAAVVAAQHSAAKHSSVVAVDYTLAKFVRKPRGAKPGAVTYQREKTIMVDPARR